MEDALAPPPVAPSPAPLAAAAVLTRRRSHLDSASYRTLSRLFSHCFHLHPSRREAPAPLDPEPAAVANPTCGESGEPPQAPKDVEFDRRNDVEEEAATVSPSCHETISPATDDPAATDPTSDPREAGQGSLEDVVEVVAVESTCCKTNAVGEVSVVGAGLVVDDEALKSVTACLEGEVDESVEGAVGNGNEQLLLDAMMTNFSGLIDDVGAGAMTAQNCVVPGGELQNSKASEESKQLGGGIKEDRPVGNSDHRQIDGCGFEEGEIEGELQDLDAEESGDLEHGDEDADDEKLDGNSVSRGSEAKESCYKDTVEENGHLVLNKDATVRDHAHMPLTRAHAVSYDEVVDWNETPLPDDEAPSPGKKRKRNLTEARKAQKTKNKRMKRAQERIAEGVKPLKLRPIIKPKEPKPCHFYDNGKCQQGNSCKFSHDFTPKTKSKPCKHFACGSCLKGDDCPYDHELSKYRCHKYESGMCFRGDKCKFSHVMPTTEGTSTPDAKKSDASLAFENANLREQTSSQKTSAVHNGEPVTSAPTKQQNSILKSLAGISINSQKASAHIPKGLQFLPFGKGGSNSSRPHQDALCIETQRNANSSQHQYLGGHQTEGLQNVNKKGEKLVPLLDEKKSSKESTAHPCSDPKKATVPTDSIATPGSVQTQHEEASRILQEFLFGSGS